MDAQQDVLAGRVAVVTGSTRGLGLAMARLLGHQGATVVLASRSDVDVADAVDQLRAEGSRRTGGAVTRPSGPTSKRCATRPSRTGPSTSGSTTPVPPASTVPRPPRPSTTSPGWCGRTSSAPSSGVELSLLRWKESKDGWEQTFLTQWFCPRTAGPGGNGARAVRDGVPVCCDAELSSGRGATAAEGRGVDAMGTDAPPRVDVGTRNLVEFI